MRDNGIPNIPGIKIGGVLDTYTRKQADERFQSTLSEEQLANIDDVPSKASKKELEAVRKALDGDKQDNLTPKQLAVLADIEKLDLMVQEEIGKINKETEESLEAVRTEGERVEDSLPDDYVALSETVSNTANAIKGFTNDNVVSLTDVSPIKHIMGVKVTGVDNPENVTVARYGKNIIGGNKDVSIPWGTANVDFDSNTQEFTINGTGSSTSNIAFENFGYKIYPVVSQPTVFTLSMTHIDGNISGEIPEYNVLVKGGFEGSAYTLGRLSFPTTGNAQTKIVIGASTLTEGAIALQPVLNIGNGAVYDNYKFKLQLEVGDTATEYEPYTCETYTPNADGTVEGVTSLYPNTTLLPSTNNAYQKHISGAVIECEYNQDTNKVLKKTLNDSGKLTDEQLANVDKIPAIEAELETKASAERVDALATTIDEVWQHSSGTRGAVEALEYQHNQDVADIENALTEKQDKLTDEQLANIDAVPTLFNDFDVLAQVIGNNAERIENVETQLNSSELSLIGSTALSEPVSNITINQDLEGNSFELDELYAWVKIPSPNSINPNVYFTDGTVCYTGTGNLGSNNTTLVVSWKRGYLGAKVEQYQYYNSFKSAMIKDITDDIIVNQFRMQVFGDSVFPAGTEVKVWGKKV